ncbi:hypothetical protein MKK63_11760 [Methylobacterium sp. J-088]|uniref:hypothetical protein n=1 Tax=Methylobacterium sp. J-088 TaxID=2836664 RepID=UPI001FBACCEA|nr:hypothetical protein [Methylobacterium sp. J-088]MCJ2063385.1 hypothetical protein [Methylobacterium sp. J-088]
MGKALSLAAPGNELDALHVIASSLGKEGCILTVGKTDECYVSHIIKSKDEKYAALLFRRSSPDASTPIFGHRKTRRLRRAEKHKDEDLSVSSHLFLDLTESPGRKGRYRAIIEEVPGIGRSYIRSVLNLTLRQSEYSYKDHGGNEKQTYTIADLEGFRSATIGEALKGGTISFVELVRQSRIDGLDTEAFEPREERMRIEIKARGEGMLTALRTLNPWADAGGWEDIRVSIRMPEGKSRVVPLSRESDAADVLFVRAEQVYVESHLDACAEEVVGALFDRAVEMFSKDWSKRTEE